MNEQKATLNVNGMKIEIKVISPEIKNDIGVFTLRESKRNVFDLCRQTRSWVAKDFYGNWFLYPGKPTLCGDTWKSFDFPHVTPTQLVRDLYDLPFITYKDSLITPNGEFYYDAKKAREYRKKVNGWKQWYATNTKTVSKKTDTELKRGDPVFVWDDYYDDTIPAIVMYFHHFYDDKKKKIFTYALEKMGAEGLIWENYRKFDPALVGVPRKDWPKE